MGLFSKMFSCDTDKTAEEKVVSKPSLRDEMLRVGDIKVEKELDFYRVYVREPYHPSIEKWQEGRTCFEYYEKKAFFDETEANEYAADMAIKVRNDFIEHIKSGSYDLPQLSAEDMKQWNKKNEQLKAGA